MQHVGQQFSGAELPVEPPSTTICRSTGTALGRQVVVVVDGGELVSAVGGETVAGVARVPAHPDAEQLVLAVNSDNKMSVNIVIDQWRHVVTWT